MKGASSTTASALDSNSGADWKDASLGRQLTFLSPCFCSPVAALRLDLSGILALLNDVDSVTGVLAFVGNRLGELTLGMDAVIDLAVDADCVLLARACALARFSQKLGSMVEADVGLARPCALSEFRPGSVLTDEAAIGLDERFGFEASGRRLETLGLNDNDDDDGFESVLGLNALGRRFGTLLVNHVDDLDSALLDQVVTDGIPTTFLR